jgi:hypothetical protein
MRSVPTWSRRWGALAGSQRNVVGSGAERDASRPSPSYVYERGTLPTVELVRRSSAS